MYRCLKTIALLVVAVGLLAVDEVVHYEDFGAVGDGITDDLPAICAAHERANEIGARVVARGDATYHLGRRALTAIIATDVDWNTARFIIDDTDVEDHKRPLFEVRSQLEPVELSIDHLVRDQQQLNLRPATATFVRVEDDSRRRYIRRGLNQNQGKRQHDCFVLHPDGRIEGAIDWDYERFSAISAQPVDPEPLTISGGVFTTIANRPEEDSRYNYHARNIAIRRSRTVVEGVTHLIEGEGERGYPYRGFLSATRCAYITFRDCTVSGHKTYRTIGSAGKPVPMGSYDLHANEVVDFRMIDVRMNDIHDRSRWGVIATNFCKGITLERCTLSRMDTHMGVSGHYVLKDCVLGYMGLKAIGRGRLRMERTTVHAWRMIDFRRDYGSTWDGTVEIVDCTWVPRGGSQHRRCLLGTVNDGSHDFGYPCSMPTTVTIDGLRIEDGEAPEGYQGVFVFSDPGGKALGEQPFPYRRPESVTARDVTIESGVELQLSPDPTLADQVAFTISP